VDNGILVTMDVDNRIYPDGGLYIEGDRIQDVGDTSEVRKRHPSADIVINAEHHIVLPGLINCHCHTMGSLRRYLGADLPILEWLKTSKWPYHSRLTPEIASHGAQLGILENLRFGNTTIVENYYPPRSNKQNVDEIMKMADKHGIRCILARGCHDNPETTPEAFLETPQEIIQEYTRLFKTYHGTHNGRLQVAIAPINLRNITPEGLSKLQEITDQHQLIMHTHVAEGKAAVEQVKSQYGKPYIEVFHEYGLLNERFHAAHAVWISPKEIRLLADAKATVVYNPSSNMTLGSGVCPIPQLRENQVNLAFGADSPGSNWTLDLLNHLGLGVMLQKVHHLDPQVMTAHESLHMATQGGAIAIGQQDQLGCLEPGKKGDVITIDTTAPHLQPIHDPIAAVVYGATGTDVATVIVDGRLILKEKAFVEFDSKPLILEAAQAAHAFKTHVDASMKNSIT
jgi:5-methylthioadenosine/S-adenosylhomocysteine deaminase